MPDFPGQLLNKTCWQLIRHMYCKFLLPKCDLTSSKPRPQPICKEACQKFNDRCQDDWGKVLKMYHSKFQLISWGVQSVVSGGMQRGTSLMWCKGLPKRNGPNAPECYYPEMLKGKRLTLFNVQNMYSRLPVDCPIAQFHSNIHEQFIYGGVLAEYNILSATLFPGLPFSRLLSKRKNLGTRLPYSSLCRNAWYQLIQFNSSSSPRMVLLKRLC